MVEGDPAPTCARLGALAGLAVGVTGDRRADELMAHLTELGAAVVHGPMLRTRPIAPDGDLVRAATDAVIASPPDYLLVTTGIGMRTWWNAAAAWSRDQALLAALRSTRILARGPKAIGAVTGLGLDVWFSAPEGRTDEMVERVLAEPLAGAHVALQLPGRSMFESLRPFEAAGALVTGIPVYDWTWPDDLAPARRLLRAVVDRHVVALTFTSRPAVRNMLDLADAEGARDDVVAALQHDVIAVCIGAVTAGELARATGTAPITPARPILGTLVPALVQQVSAKAHHHVALADATEVVVQGRVVVAPGGVSVTMSDREADLLRALVSDRRRAVTKDVLLRTVWRDVVDPSVLETTIARLRRRIARTGLRIETVNGRGYLLAGEPTPCPVPSLTTAGGR